MEESSKWAANQPSLQRLQALTTSLKSDLDQSQAMEASAQERRMQRMVRPEWGLHWPPPSPRARPRRIQLVQGAAKRTGRAATGGAAEDGSGVRCDIGALAPLRSARSEPSFRCSVWQVDEGGAAIGGVQGGDRQEG